MATKGDSAQKLSLPTGGGALRGIGETFSPDLHTGSGNFSIPIAVPAGRNGLQPKLSLDHSSGSGNGPFGLGWSLSIPGVSRKTSKGIPRYRDGAGARNEEDIFLLSGAEDLVPVAEEPGVTRYRPRTEGLFARIERHRTSGTDHWEVRTREGLLSHYGTPGALAADPAIVADPEARHRVSAWSLTKTVDPFGNVVEYEYDRDAGEIDRPWDQIYLRRIRYADYEEVGPGGDPAAKFLVSLTFDYENRPDPFSDNRAGFEVRTRRRCTRIAVRTHADRDRLVRTCRLIYLDQTGLPAEQLPANAASLLSRLIVEGHDEESSEALPPLDFRYTAFEPKRRRYQPIGGTAENRPPRSLAHPEYDLVDLFGRGLPDVIEIDEQVRYWRNLGGGRFDSMRTMESAPVGLRLSDPGVQLLDARGNGRTDLVVLDGVRNGYHPLTFRGGWKREGFVPYGPAPSVSLDATDVRLIDLDGDGVTDALRSGARLELYHSSPEGGWAAVELRERAGGDDFPDVDFADPRVKLADMTGDGLQDVVLIRDGRVEYWPYRGHGRWGRRIVMRDSPRFEDAAIFSAASFDPRRLLVGDVDGDGVADLVYVSSGHVTVWINRGGNGWSDPIVVRGTPPVTDATAVRLADMLGTGTDGILWTYDFGAFADSSYKFLDLTGGTKPYLLDRMDNNMGAATEIAYAASTRFWAEDEERPETRWRTPLPFPVQVVARVEVIDRISGGKLTTQYRYHHGYWDGEEREFRGFGKVEQLDTETFAAYHASGPGAGGSGFEAVAAENYSPPLLTRRWFHQGPVDDEEGGWRTPDWSTDYWKGDPPALAHAGTVDTVLSSLAEPSHRRDARRTLRGSPLRTEVYALDGSDRQGRPYTVTEHGYGLREESPPAGGSDGGRPRIFFPHAIAERVTQWERGDEPMTRFTFTDDHDAFGQPRRTANLAVPRHRDPRVAAPAGEPYLGTTSEIRYAQRDDAGGYMVDRVAQTRTFEVLNDGGPSVQELYRHIREGAAELALIGQTCHHYDGEAFVGLPLGELGAFGALVRSETLVMTEAMLSEAWGDPSDPGGPDIPFYLRPGGPAEPPAEYPAEFGERMPALAGYVFADGSDHRARGYFVQSARVAFDFHLPGLPPRGLPVAQRDPFGAETRTAYDRPFHLLPVRVTDAAGLESAADQDYRVLGPRMTTDANGNRRAVTLSPLGLVTSTAVMGKADEQVGDTPETPGSRLEYDFFAFAERGQPVFVRSIVRQHHVSEDDVDLPERDETIETVEYSDGFGRLLQSRTQAEDVLFGDPRFGGGVLPRDQSLGAGDAVGTPASADAPNVVVSGWQVYDNKGRVVEKYEPFFATGWDFAAPSDAERGQKAVMAYDPRGRLVRTRNPDGSEQRMIQGVPPNLADPDTFAPTPWESYSYDANDLAPLSLDPLKTLPDGSPASLARRAPEAHHFTPASAVVDALGRTVLAVTRNGRNGDDEIATRSSYDIRGNLLSLTDALDRVAFRNVYDLADRPWRVESIDAGLCRMAADASGSETERRDGKNALLLQAYDLLRRPARLWARDDGSAPITMRQRLDYGDSGAPDQSVADRAAMRQRNLLGRVHRHHDEAGLSIVERADFKGNVLDKSRRVLADGPIVAALGSFQVDWQPAPQQSLADREAFLLEERAYRTSTRLDALNRIKRLQFPEDVDGRRPVLQPRYNRAGGLEQVKVDERLLVERIVHDAKGQRTLIVYGNGTMTRYAYDMRSFRLARLRSERFTRLGALGYRPGGEVFQDLGYDYDLAGNIVEIRDRAAGSGIPNNPQAAAAGDPALAQMFAAGDALDRSFDYDALYRLVSATGRECDRPADAEPWLDQPRCADLTRCRAYTEAYRYDAMGNMERLEHRSGPDGFVRDFAVDGASNRLRRMEAAGTGHDYRFDSSGNMRSESASRHFDWNHADLMKAFRVQAGAADPSIQAHYCYDADGQRVKKMVRRQGGQIEVTHYIDGTFEHRRWAGPEAGENNHVHVLDDKQRIALVRVGDAQTGDARPDVRFELGDHLGSSSLVLDPAGAVLNREEYTPFGETSFGSFAKKRYRFSAKERDEESSLSYHGSRYYAPWMARWTNTDPLGMLSSDKNLYTYVSNRPVIFIDPSGNEKEEPWPIEDNTDKTNKDRQKPEISIPIFGGSVVDEPLTGSPEKKIGNLKILSFELKIDVTNQGGKLEFGILDADVNVPIIEGVEITTTAKAVKGEATLSRKKIGVDASLFETGIGLKTDVAKAKVLFGLSGGLGWDKGKIKVKVVFGLGAEVEVDIGRLIQPIRPQIIITPTIELSNPPEETGMRSQTVSRDDPPPPPPKPKPKVLRKPVRIKYSEAYEYLGYPLKTAT